MGAPDLSCCPQNLRSSLQYTNCWLWQMGSSSLTKDWTQAKSLSHWTTREVPENGLISLFYKWLSSFPSTTCWKKCLFSIVYFFVFSIVYILVCCKLIDYKCMGLFLFSLYSVPLIFVVLCVCVCVCERERERESVDTMLFWLQLLCNIVWSVGGLYLQLCYFLKIVLVI